MRKLLILPILLLLSPTVGVEIRAEDNVRELPSPPITAFEQTKDLEKKTMYCLNDTKEFVASDYTAAAIDNLPIGAEVLIVGEEDDFYITHQMTYVHKDLLTSDKTNVWYPCKETKYVKSKSLPNFSFNTELQLVARNCEEKYKTSDGKVIKKSDLMDKKYIPPVETKSALQASMATAPVSYGYSGTRLTPSAGRIQGPSGPETYYNLPMAGVVNIMAGYGYSGYGVRADGVKTLNGYVMVAANLNVHPRGSLVATSLGTGLVCDTGGFAAGNPTQLDIAVAW